jgi:hypothetical protein
MILSKTSAVESRGGVIVFARIVGKAVVSDMPRYIDANKLKNRILEERDKIPLTVIERYSLGTPVCSTINTAMRGGIRKALRCMERTPTEDVVPRAEVIRLQDQVNRLKKYDEERDIVLHSRLISETRQKVAQEIFDEIKKYTRTMYTGNWSGAYRVCSVLMEDVERLEKNYTEDR